MLGDLLNLNRFRVVLVDKFRGDLDWIWRDGLVELLGKRIHDPGDSDNASLMVAKGDLAGHKGGKFAVSNGHKPNLVLDLPPGFDHFAVFLLIFVSPKSWVDFQVSFSQQLTFVACPAQMN